MTYNYLDGKYLLYLDGVNVGNRTTTASGTINTNTKDINIGRISTGGIQFNGIIDEVMIFNRSLFSEEILSLYNASANQYSYNHTGMADGNHTFVGYAVDDKGNVNNTEERIISANGNVAPNTPVVTLNASSSSNISSDNLLCNTLTSDDDGDGLTVDVDWYVNGSYNQTNSYAGIANNTNFTATLASGNTTKNQNWSCSVRFYDGSEYGSYTNTSNITILNHLPVVTLTAPSDWSSTTNRTPEFTWSLNDADGDTVTYDINISDYKFAGAFVCSDSRTFTGVSGESYIPTSVLLCLHDNGYYYNWTVRGNDGDGYGEWTSISHVNITTDMTISLSNSGINFGSMDPLAVNDTTDDNPLPLVIQNDGTVLTNISINSSALWVTQPDNSSNYQAKTDNVTGEEGAFAWISSLFDWFDVPITGEVVMIDQLNYEDDTDSAEIDIRIDIPENEAPGAKEAVIVFKSVLAE